MSCALPSLEELGPSLADLLSPEPDPEPEATPGAWSLPVPSPPAIATWTSHHPLAVRRGIAGLLAAWMVVTGAILLVRPPRGDDDGPAETAPAAPVDPELVRVATARTPLVDVYESPTQDVVLMTLEHPTPAAGPLVFLVHGDWEGWYKVRVPTPPAGMVAWVRAEDVEVAEHRVHITVDLDAHLLVVRDAGEIKLRAPVAVGLRDHPEPGHTFVTDRVALTNERAGYGTLALPLAGYSNGVDTFFRGSGLVALHGLEDPLALGQTVPRGSVGIADDDMRTLYDLTPLGAAVEVIGEDPRSPTVRAKPGRSSDADSYPG